MSKRNLKEKPLAVLATVTALSLLPVLIKNPYTLHVLILAGIHVTLACSLRLIALSGQLSLAHGGMMAVGGYTSAILVTRLGWSYWSALPLAGAAAGLLALAAGYPFVRLKGIYFSMVTVFFAEVILLTAEQWRGLTGGSSGIIGIPRPDPIVLPGVLALAFSSKAHFYYLILALTLVTLLILYALEHSRVGVRWQCIRQTDFLAESVGINTSGLKVLAFVTGSFFAGLAGSFYAHYIGIIGPRTFGFLYAIYILVYMVTGGAGRFSGPLLGACLLTLLPEIFRPLKQYQPFLFAGVMMAVILFLPEGLVGLPRLIRSRFGSGSGNA